MLTSSLYSPTSAILQHIVQKKEKGRNRNKGKVDGSYGVAQGIPTAASQYICPSGVKVDVFFLYVHLEHFI